MVALANVILSLSECGQKFNDEILAVSLNITTYNDFIRNCEILLLTLKLPDSTEVVVEKLCGKVFVDILSVCQKAKFRSQRQFRTKVQLEIGL